MNVGSMLSSVAGLAILVCWIMVLIRMFKESAVKGILGLICGLYAFIWGWMNSGQGLKNIMLIWTIAILIGMLGGYFTGFPSVMK
jgi:hypothetical protein